MFDGGDDPGLFVRRWRLVMCIGKELVAQFLAETLDGDLSTTSLCANHDGGICLEDSFSVRSGSHAMSMQTARVSMT